MATLTPKAHPAGDLEALRAYNLDKNCHYADHELRRINARWSSLGKIARQPASLRNAQKLG